MNESIDKFNHESGILPLSTYNLFASAFVPTLSLLPFKVAKFTVIINNLKHLATMINQLVALPSKSVIS